ncbi:Protein of unknown function (DUF410) [Nesidiocoris tenuis]|uniref:Golgi to ER traffic protein 4 homolog n=1 Tax=Nesidiocoris tenuis TaxID=355587 RepID=A0ABN7BB50_9HEMI|nr:Protein of unknown function (DUF410) [Nesidiocoris tenuis]
MAQNKSNGVQRVIMKIENNIKSRNFYEAHQLYKTLYSRFMAQKKYEELLNLLYDGATLLLENDQQMSGVDLGLLYIEVLVHSKAKESDDYIQKIGKLFSLISPRIPERDKFLSAAVRWSSGSPQLHQSIARIYWKERNYSMARKHFLRSYDGSSFGTMLVELHRTSGYSNEVDLFIAQTVLQCLCLNNKKTAVITFQCYTTQHPSITEGPPYLLPLLNFVWFLLQVVDSGKLATFTVLCQEYQLSLERDPSYRHYLTKIGQMFFGVPPPAPARHGMFGNILESLVSSLDDYSDDESPPARSRAQPPVATTSKASVVMETDLD